MSVELKSIEKAKSLLKQLFRSDNADLDFGIYRIMNFKRAEIEKFIDKDLIEAAEAEFREFAKVSTTELEKKLEKLRIQINEVSPNTIDNRWNVTKNHNSPKVQEFLGVLKNYNEASVSEEQIQDIFNHVYEFFSRYYVDGDFIPRTRYGGSDKYFVPYNGEEVLLHWATKDMYYIKTDEYFNKYTFKTGKNQANFVLVEAQIEQSNIKGDNKYFILHGEDPVFFDPNSGIVEIRFNYRALTDQEKEKYGPRRIQDTLVDIAFEKISASLGQSSLHDILRPSDGKAKSSLKKHLEAYVERNTKDFFIHKDLKGFLSKELDFYLKNEVWDLTELNNITNSQIQMTRAKSKAICSISSKIIAFLMQVEEFQKRLYEKKKLILKTNFIITLDRIKDYCGEEYLESIVTSILENKSQLNEWQELLGINIKNEGDLISKRTLDSKKWKKLPVDTVHFDIDFKLSLLEHVTKNNDLDKVIDGVLLKSENWQALNLLENTFGEKVKVMYIDPPFNTGKDGFLYKDMYNHSSWLTMMHNRLGMAEKLLDNKGSIFVQIDYNENMRLKLLLDNIFGESNFLNELVWKRTFSHGDVGQGAKHLGRLHDLILLYVKSNECKLNELFTPYSEDYIKKNFKHIEKSSGRRFQDVSLTAPGGVSKGNPYYEFLGVKRYWQYSKENMRKLLEQGRIYQKRPGNVPRKKMYLDEAKGVPLQDLWLDISPIQGQSKEYLDFKTQKPEKFMKRIVELATDGEELVLDFFIGSGTTVAVAHKLRRKWIGIEMSDYFSTIVIPRLKEVLAGFGKHEPGGISKEEKWDGGGFIKYHNLEQYEDSLNNIEFVQPDGSIQRRLDRLPDYFVTYMLDYETRDSPSRLALDRFETPFDYRIKTVSGGEEREEPVDLVETFNYLLGLHVHKLKAHNDGGRLYWAVFGERDNEQIVVIWRNSVDLDLEQDRGFIEKNILSDTNPDTIFINGDSYLENASPIEPEFKRLMGV